jgi:hypothetical protein
MVMLEERISMIRDAISLINPSPSFAAIGILKLETDSIVLSSAYALAKARGRGDQFLRGFGWR